MRRYYSTLGTDIRVGRYGDGHLNYAVASLLCTIVRLALKGYFHMAAQTTEKRLGDLIWCISASVFLRTVRNSKFLRSAPAARPGLRFFFVSHYWLAWGSTRSSRGRVPLFRPNLFFLYISVSV